MSYNSKLQEKSGLFITTQFLFNSFLKFAEIFMWGPELNQTYF